MACYPGVSPQQAVELAAAAAGLADAAGIPLMIDLRPAAVVFDSGKDQWEVVGFLDLAGAVQGGAARAAGLAADNSRVLLTTAIRYEHRISRPVWTVVAPVHRLVTRSPGRDVGPVGGPGAPDGLRVAAHLRRDQLQQLVRAQRQVQQAELDPAAVGVVGR